MGYIVEKKQNEVVEAALQTTEKSFTTPKDVDQSISAPSSTEAISAVIEKVYFQIED